MVDVKLRGAVDGFFSEKILGGWVLPAGTADPGTTQVRVLLDGQDITATQDRVYRKDIGANCGFRVVLTRPITPELVADRRLVFRCIDNGTTLGEIAIHGPSFQKFCRKQEAERLEKIVSGLSTTEAAAFFEKWSDRNLLALIDHAERRLGKTPPDPSAELSHLPVQVGLRSRCGTARVGRDGYLFLVGGRNSLIDVFQRSGHEPEIQTFVRRWLDLFQARKATLDTVGVHYLQIVIPEKISVQSQFYPESLQVPNPIYRGIMAEAGAADWMLDVHSEFMAEPDPAALYRKLDSHFTIQGSILATRAMLAALGERFDFPDRFESAVRGGADLGSKFGGLFGLEDCADMDAATKVSLPGPVERVETLGPPDGKHIGIRAVFRCAGAPINKRLVVFGNSFFERGASPRGLTWWCARLFREFHFVWNPELDMEYVEQVKPDIVVCQTIERFLIAVPPK